MKLFNLKISYLVIPVVFLFFTGFAQQKPIKAPSLDGKNVFEAKLSPDPEINEVLSTYLKGKTTKDTLRIKIKGTWVIQNIGITILSLNKNEEIGLQINKGNWKNIAKKGITNSGFYQTAFQTSGDIGISIYSNKIGIPFNVIIWASGELKPKMDNLFVSIEEYNKIKHTNYGSNNDITTSDNTKTASQLSTTQQTKGSEKSNFFNYVIIVVLIIIVILLFLLLKKKKNTSLSLFLMFFMISNYSFSQISQSDMNEIKANLSYFPAASNAIKIVEFFNKGKDGTSHYDLLTKGDSDYQPNLDPNGQPKLPSSCKKIGNKTPTKKNKRKKNPRRNTNTTDQDNKYDDIDKPKYDNSDRPKYDKDGKPIIYEDNQPLSNENSTPTDNSIEQDNIDRPKYDNDGNVIQYDAAGRPKFDRNDNYIDYDNSKRPKFDYQGNPIDYPVEDKNTIYNIDGRPRFDKSGNTIQYDNVQHPNYDRHGNLIQYEIVDQQQNSENSNISEDNTSNRTNDVNIEVTNDKNGPSQSDQNQENTATNESNRATDANEVDQDSSNENELKKDEGCDCLAKAYGKLYDLRFKFEKLRIIRVKTEKILKYAISFGDDVSPSTGSLGALAWQKERVKILKNMDDFYKAYDNKYLQFVKQLNKILLEIDKCESKLDFENWYSKVGFIYYDFMKDKYKRN